MLLVVKERQYVNNYFKPDHHLFILCLSKVISNKVLHNVKNTYSLTVFTRRKKKQLVVHLARQVRGAGTKHHKLSLHKDCKETE